jgi:hypothetical protein
MPPGGFEPTISAGERAKTYALDGATCRIGEFWDKYLIFVMYHPDTLYLWEQGYEDPRVFFRNQKGSASKKFQKHGLMLLHLHWYSLPLVLCVSISFISVCLLAYGIVINLFSDFPKTLLCNLFILLFSHPVYTHTHTHTHTNIYIYSVFNFTPFILIPTRLNPNVHITGFNSSVSISQ